MKDASGLFALDGMGEATARGSAQINRESNIELGIRMGFTAECLFSEEGGRHK